jgi:FAD/FMN-containing dehydrogenase
MTGFQTTNAYQSWGRVLNSRHRVARPTFRDELMELVRTAAPGPNGVLATGKRRSYGDTCLNSDGAIIDTTALDRLISFDPITQRLKAEAGATIAQVLDFIVPLGFFLPVVPGTQNITLGGAVANDIHGKNHHGYGTFGYWVKSLGLLRSDASEITIGPNDRPELFAATVGGLGLTGVITFVELELIPISSSIMNAETFAFGNLDEFFSVSMESAEIHDYTVSWIDCLSGGSSAGRGLFTRAQHSSNGPLQNDSGSSPGIPFDPPVNLLNSLSIRAFNTLYFHAGRFKKGPMQFPYRPFFFPLDAIANWNRLYGSRGFYQYQSVVPPAVAADATAEMLRQIRTAGEGSFLAVLKTFGSKASPGLMSFPMEGTTLALDFPNRGADTLKLLGRLDDVVRQAKGRLYPAKDGRLPRRMFFSGYPNLERFTAQLDPGISSSFWRRINS